MMAGDGTPGPAREAARIKHIGDATATLDMLVQFAYEHGFHELGYDPVAALTAVLAPGGDSGGPREAANVGSSDDVPTYTKADVEHLITLATAALRAELGRTQNEVDQAAERDSWWIAAIADEAPFVVTRIRKRVEAYAAARAATRDAERLPQETTNG